jgi:microfibrillar-associated protein 1
MAPPVPNPSKRMTANPARPVARYRPGKAVQEETSSEEDGPGDEIVTQQFSRQTQPKASSFPCGAQRRRQTPVPKTQNRQSEDEEGFVTEDEDEDEGDTGEASSSAVSISNAAYQIAPKTTEIAISRTTKAAEAELTEDGGSGQSEEDSRDSEESSSEEEPRRSFQRPIFMKKSARQKATFAPGYESLSAAQDGLISTSSPKDTMRTEEARRKDVTDSMIKDKLERDAIARAAGRKGWDDDDELAAEEMVDDADGVDPEAEYAAWKLRELKRLKRDREAIEQREEEIEEIDRRRNLTQAEREAEDRDYLEHQKEEREEGRGKAGFLHRYHHKGAFFQDDETAEALRKRDLMGAKFVDEVQNREALPQYMQVRDMTKLGKKGRTRYTDLRGEDTGKWGQGYTEKEKKGPKMDFAVDERFRPDHDDAAKGPTGANASIILDRRGMKVGGAPERTPPVPTDNQGRNTDRGGPDKPRTESRERTERSERAGWQSPSPPRRRSSSGPRSTSIRSYGYCDEEGRSRRKRSPSYQNREKRRRVEAT